MAESNAKNNGVDSSSCVTPRNQLRPLHCAAQQYAWGRLGSSSIVARMKLAQVEQDVLLSAQSDDGYSTDESKDDPDDFFIDETKPYAELWLGTHPNGMSFVSLPNTSAEMIQSQLKAETGSDRDPNGQENGNGMQPEIGPEVKCSLLDYVRQQPALHCGSDNTASGEEQDLSFLLKVLSVRKVLSIQAHPDKALAAKLHAERPKIYKDPNHKPEMAIALSEQVRAMCGFRPVSEIHNHLVEYPEFAELLGDNLTSEIRTLHQQLLSGTSTIDSENMKDVMQRMFHGYIESDAELLHRQVEKMVERIRTQQHWEDEVQKLILQLSEQFPGDCGIFAPLIFNIITLQQNEALFISANEPHAYVSGEIIECMACSDNVVRAGLTPKLKDVPTLVNMLTYQCGLPAISSGTEIDSCTKRYQPPVEDFCVEIITVPPNQTYEIRPVASPSVLLTMEGEAGLCQRTSTSNLNGNQDAEIMCHLEVSFGVAAFLSANTHCIVEAGLYGVRLTRAFTNVYHNE